MSRKINAEQFANSLSNLESMAKSQLFHTANSSEPGKWAGSEFADVDSMDDSIDPNGLDYNGVKKLLGEKVSKGHDLTHAEYALVKGQDPIPYIVDKIEKGHDLTLAEQWVVKAVQEDAEEDEDEEEEDEDEGEDEDYRKNKMKKSAAVPGKAEAPGTLHDALHGPGTLSAAMDEKEDEEAEVTHKSLDQAVGSSYVMKSGIEMSPFLYEFVNAVDSALKGVEARVTNKLAKSLDRLATVIDARDAAQSDFFKSLAESVVGIGEITKAQLEDQVVKSSFPTRAPKSTMAKSIGGLAVDTDSLQKSQILDIMVDMVKSNALSTQDVIAFEHTNHLPEHVKDAIAAHTNKR